MQVDFTDNLRIARERAQQHADASGEIHVIYEREDERGRFRIVPASTPPMPPPARFICSMMPNLED